jgi:hypothetical protein
VLPVLYEPMLQLLALCPILPNKTTQSPEPPTATRWNIYRLAGTARRHGTVEADSPIEAIAKAAAQFKIIASRLIAVERR